MDFSVYISIYNTLYNFFNNKINLIDYQKQDNKIKS